MIQSILILLLTNTLIPYLPSPYIAAPLPALHFLVRQTSVYEHMNLSRIHTPQQFKRTFREALKTLHPDKGGNQDTFSRVKNLKKIMEQDVNYYDTLNITDVDLEFNTPMKDAVKIKETAYYVEAGIYYFIVLLYVLAYTVQDDMKPARKYLLPVIVIFAAYQYYIHFHPQITTVFDLIHDKIPIFMQKSILKSFLNVFIAIIRAKFLNRTTEQKRLIKQLKNDHTQQQYRDILNHLSDLFRSKVMKKIQSQKSWMSKIRGWISKAFTVLILFSIARGFFNTSTDGSSSSNHDM